MDLGPLKDPADLNFGLMLALGHMVAPENASERAEFFSTWTAAGLGQCQEIEPSLTEALKGAIDGAKKRIAIKQDAEALQRAEDLSEVMALFAEVAPSYAAHELQKKFFEPFGGFSAVARAPGTVALMEAVQRSLGKAWIAAGIWIINLQIEQHHRDLRQDGGGLHKAIRVMPCEPLWQGGPSDESTLVTHWRTYRRVAHLWAAFFYTVIGLAVQVATARDRPASSLHELTNETLSKMFEQPRLFFQVAHLFGEFASTFRVGPAKRPLVDASELWLVPPFPGRDAPGALSVGPLSLAGQSALATYRVRDTNAD
jgi:hypothetical protein